MKFKYVSSHALLFAGFFCAFLLVSGCSRGNSNPEMTNLPDSTSDNIQFQDDVLLPGFYQNNTSRKLLGQWIIHFEPLSLTATVEPDRSANARYNVTQLFMSPLILIKDYDPSTGIVDVDITLNNIYTISVYDLRFIVFNNNGHELMNEDGWTASYDLPGGLPINPFKAYAKNESDRIFQATHQYTENLKIFLPGGNSNVRFAVDIAYPSHSAEPYEIANYVQATLLKNTGSSANVWVDVYDWQDDVDTVSLYCPQITGQDWVNFNALSASRFELNLTNSTGAAAGDYFGVIAAYSGGNAMYFVTKVRVSKGLNTIGLTLRTPDACEGYTLFTPMSYKTCYLVDINGNLVHSWQPHVVANSAIYLLPNGNLLHTFVGPGAPYGGIQELDWDSNVVWKYGLPDQTYNAHHDVDRLPNGNTLMVVRETKNLQECVAAGRDPSKISQGELWPDTILEIKPTGPTSGEIVWEWHSWDHLSSATGGTANGRPVSTDITDPAKLNINYMFDSSADWLHVNSVKYNPELDQIIISLHQFSEIAVISHSSVNYEDPQSGIEAARGAAGDLLYRWGNSRAYGIGGLNDQTLFQMHDAQWIEPGLPGEGNILVFNNGGRRRYSTVDEFIPPVDLEGNYYRAPGTAFGPENAIWVYSAPNPTDFFCSYISGAQRMPNGNTLICDGPTGRFFEVKPDLQVVWQYINPVNNNGSQKQGTTINLNNVFKIQRYAPDYPGLAGRDLTPGNPIELPMD
jgi:hypothetical protein